MTTPGRLERYFRIAQREGSSVSPVPSHGRLDQGGTPRQNPASGAPLESA